MAQNLFVVTLAASHALCGVEAAIDRVMTRVLLQGGLVLARVCPLVSWPSRACLLCGRLAVTCFQGCCDSRNFCRLRHGSQACSRRNGQACIDWRQVGHAPKHGSGMPHPRRHGNASDLQPLFTVLQKWGRAAVEAACRPQAPPPSRPAAPQSRPWPASRAGWATDNALPCPASSRGSTNDYLLVGKSTFMAWTCGSCIHGILRALRSFSLTTSAA